jgi:hypothetical protein
MTTIIIEDSSPQAKKLLDYIKTLPFVTVVEEKQKDFRTAARKCTAVAVDEFFNELDSRLKEHYVKNSDV